MHPLMTGNIMTAPVYLLLAAMTLGGSNHDRRGFLEFGKDPSPGLLVNLSPAYFADHSVWMNVPGASVRS